MSILSEYMPEISFKIECMENTCRFCVHKSINLMPIATKLSLNVDDEDTTSENIIISILDIFKECFGLDLQENTLDDDVPQFLCQMCLKKIIQTYKFRNQCIWALNYWDNRYQYVEIQEQIKQSDDGDEATEMYDDNKQFVRVEQCVDDVTVLSEISLEDENVNHAMIKNVNQEMIENVNPEMIENGNQEMNKNVNHIIKIDEKIIHEVQNKHRKSSNGKKSTSKYRKQPAQVCPYCGVLRVSLRTHILLHEKLESQPEFICDFCGKSFQRRAHIYRHTRIHIDIRKHKCKLCPAAFVDRTSLTKHMFNHSEERKYECSICNKKFKQSCSLSVHMLSHTLVKNIKCDYCDALFSTTTNKNKHQQNNHLKEYKYKCDFCETKFYSTSKLAVHRFSHTKHNPYKCEICEATFIRLYDFNAHNRQHKYNII